MTREQWLEKLAARLTSTVFKKAGYEVPKNIRFTCGWPSTGALSAKRKRIGECWDSGASGDKTFEIFISPALDNAMKVAGVLAHEMIHATVGIEAGHKRPFKSCALAIGLEGKMTATTEGPEFKAAVEPILAKLGKYPHAVLNGSTGAKKQSTRLIKVQCPECEFNARITRKWLDAVGGPVCPEHNSVMLEA